MTKINYHTITTDDMLNGEGLRVVLWVAGCGHFCKNCQNPDTWDPTLGTNFTNNTLQELIDKLDKPHIAGLTLSGGDPLYPMNINKISKIVKIISKQLPDKTIWLYTGFKYEDIVKTRVGMSILKHIDVLVDGKFEEDLADVNYHYAGSTNQRIIDVKDTLKSGKITSYIEKR